MFVNSRSYCSCGIRVLFFGARVISCVFSAATTAQGGVKQFYHLSCISRISRISAYIYINCHVFCSAENSPSRVSIYANPEYHCKTYLILQWLSLLLVKHRLTVLDLEPLNSFNE